MATTIAENEVIVWLLVVIPVVTVGLFTVLVIFLWCYQRLTAPRVLRQTSKLPVVAPRTPHPVVTRKPQSSKEQGPATSQSANKARGGVGVSRAEYFR
tara:strand:+ start:90 stop:383 length:294 start_codon:yes stop_codon:yes gene_type:complete